MGINQPLRGDSDGMECSVTYNQCVLVNCPLHSLFSEMEIVPLAMDRTPPRKLTEQSGFSGTICEVCHSSFVLNSAC